jgi:hypothetical protein
MVVEHARVHLAFITNQIMTGCDITQKGVILVPVVQGLTGHHPVEDLLLVYAHHVQVALVDNIGQDALVQVQDRV